MLSYSTNNTVDITVRIALLIMSKQTDEVSNQSHLFYIDHTHILQELISTDNATSWRSGPLGNSTVEASASAKALTAFHSEKWLGSDSLNTAGMRLYYGAPDNQVHELAFFINDTAWSSQFVFKGTNGNAGLTSSWTDSTGRANLYLLNMDNDLKIWSSDIAVL